MYLKSGSEKPREQEVIILYIFLYISTASEERKTAMEEDVGEMLMVDGDDERGKKYECVPQIRLGRKRHTFCHV